MNYYTVNIGINNSSNGFKMDIKFFAHRIRTEEYGIDLDTDTRWVTDRNHDRCARQDFFDRERAKGNHNPIAMISCNCSRCRVHC